MSYIRICSKCGLNPLIDDQEICSLCVPVIAKPKRGKKKETEKDFSRILRGHCYGSNTRKIYEAFCETLGWDIRKANQFGRETPLYAKNADTDRSRDVWFIFFANFDPNNLDSVVKGARVVNLIQDDGDTIIEVVDDCIGSSNPADRIVFVKTNNGYEFFGVYKIIKNGTTRIYRRFSDNYPTM